MGGLSIWHWLVVGVIILLLFGKGRFSEMMGDVAKGLKSFKKGMSEDEEAAARNAAAAPPPRLTGSQTVDSAPVAPPPAAEPVQPAAPSDPERREP
jgi:sec-independent protein translocase protein TatA